MRVGKGLHGRSGSVALPRMNDVMPAGRANLEVEEMDRRVERTTAERRMALDMVGSLK